MKQIPKIKLIAEAETEEAKAALGYQWNKEAGTRHYIGGTPSVGPYPSCESCNELMTFYSQIDSIGEEYDLADCMVIHTYVCFDCFTVTSKLAQI